MPPPRLDIGLDAGGSSTVLLCQSADSEEKTLRRGPGANPKRASVNRAVEVLADLVRDAADSHGEVDLLSICAGVAGAGLESDQEVLTDGLREVLGDMASEIHVEIVHDAEIALDAAFDAGSGVVVVAGTGSVAFARTEEGTTHRVGGWGHRLRDPGSGYDVGRAGLVAVLEALEGGRGTALRQLVREELGIDVREALIQQVYDEDLPLQTVAPLVVQAARQDDPVASEILDRETAGLVRQVEWLVDQADTVAPRMALLGGMLQNESYFRRLREALCERFPQGSVERLTREPVEGALRRAQRLGAS